MSNMSSKLSAMRIYWGKVRQQDRSAPDKDLLHSLKQITFFENLRRHELEEVARLMFVRDYQENEMLFESGQPGEALFIILSGEVSIEVMDTAFSLRSIAKLGKNSFVGEMALMNNSARSATARALVPTKAIALFRSDLERLLSSHPEIAARIFQALAGVVGQRLKATNALIEGQKIKVAA